MRNVDKIPCARAADFKVYLKRLGYSKSSQSMLPTCVGEFLEELEKKEIYELWQIEPTHIQQHYEYLGQRPNKRKSGGLSSRMIAHHMYAVRLFLNYQEALGNVNENPISSLSFPSPESEQRAVLTIGEIKQLYEATETFKERAILGVFYGCGLRRSEGEALDIKDISLRNALLYVRKGKGSKRRVVPINQTVLEDLKSYLYRERSAALGETAFVCNQRGKRMTGETFNDKIKELLKRAEINKEISLHNLRHSIATHLLENGMSVEYVRDFLGHKHLEATQIYTRISKRKLGEL